MADDRKIILLPRPGMFPCPDSRWVCMSDAAHDRWWRMFGRRFLKGSLFDTENFGQWDALQPAVEGPDGKLWGGFGTRARRLRIG